MTLVLMIHYHQQGQKLWSMVERLHREQKSYRVLLNLLDLRFLEICQAHSFQIKLSH